MSAPLLILLLGLVLAAAAFAWRGRQVAAPLVASVGALLLGALALGVVLGEPIEVMGVGVKLEAAWSVLGRSLVLEPENRPWVGFTFLSASMLLAGAALAGAPRRTASIGLLVSLAVAASLMVRPFVFSPVFLATAAILGCFLVVRPSGAPGRAPARLLIAYVLAMMAILVAGWLIETRGVTSSPEAPARAAAILLALGLAILVMTPPGHTWLTAAADEAHPMAMVLLASALQISGLLFLVSLLQSYAWMRSDRLVFASVRAAGLVMILVGALACAGERRLPRVAAYALLVDFGVSLLAVASGTVAGLAVALGMAAARGLSAVVWGMGVGSLTGEDQGRGAETAQGSNGPARLAAVVGGLGLAGLPLTAGFPGRWMVLATSGDPLAIAAVLMGMLSVASAVLRWPGFFWTRPTSRVPWQNSVRGNLLLGASAAVVLLGVIPSLSYGWTLTALTSLAGLMPAGLP